MNLQIKIASQNTGFLPSYDPNNIDQVLKPYGALGQLKEKIR